MKDKMPMKDMSKSMPKEMPKAMPKENGMPNCVKMMQDMSKMKK